MREHHVVDLRVLQFKPLHRGGPVGIAGIFPQSLRCVGETFEPADVVILDKVICCYPDAERIVEKSAAQARRAYAYSIPRNRWYMRLGVAVTAFVMRLFRSDFRPYVHDPERIDAWLTTAGFARRYEHRTVAWLTRAYVRG